MDYAFTEEQKMFQDAVKDWVQKEVVPVVAEAEKNHTCPRELFTKLGKLGYLCPGYPEEIGGGGLGMVGCCILVEELGRVCSGICSPLMVHMGLATFAIYQYGTEAQKEKFLYPAIRGEKIASFGLTEPNAGSDAAGIQTTARKEGNYYIVNGNKIFITSGQICDFVTLAVSTDRTKGTRGLSTLIVEKGTPGFSVNKMNKLGHHSSATGELVFEDCRVPVSNLIGQEGSGFKYTLGALTPGRIEHAAETIGLARGAFELALDYAKQREQFGQPIGKFQAIAFKLARMATEVEASRALLYRVASFYDKGENCVKEAAMVKYYGAEVGVRVAEDAMRIFAGAGYLAESTVERFYRDAILYPTAEGTTEIMELVISRELGL